MAADPGEAELGLSDSDDSYLLETDASVEIIPYFNPEDPDNNVEQWLARVDQLADINGWSAAERLLCSQMRLAGAAKGWFNRLGSYQYTWQQWKAALLKAFPRRFDYAEAMCEMIARVKKTGESLTQYYHEKMELIDRVDMKGEKAVSFLIQGLPEELKGGARAFRCTRPEVLYAEYISKVCDFRRYDEEQQTTQAVPSYETELPKVDIRRPSPRRTSPRCKSPKGTAPAVRSLHRCYNCQQMTSHYSRDCPEPQQARCMTCGNTGHLRRDCPQRGGGAVAREERRRLPDQQPELGGLVSDGRVRSLKSVRARVWR